MANFELEPTAQQADPSVTETTVIEVPSYNPEANLTQASDLETLGIAGILAVGAIILAALNKR